ncbi:MAG: hypothetical protein WAK26_11685 [Terracidiphilus sp.]
MSEKFPIGNTSAEQVEEFGFCRYFLQNPIRRGLLPGKENTVAMMTNMATIVLF